MEVALDVMIKQQWPDAIKTFDKQLAEAEAVEMDAIPTETQDVIIAVCAFWNQIGGRTKLMDLKASAALLEVLKKGSGNHLLVTDRHIATILACRNCTLDEVKDLLAKVAARELTIHNRAEDKHRSPVFKFPSFDKNTAFKAKVWEYESRIQRLSTKWMKKTNYSGTCLITGETFSLEEY